MDEKEFVKEVSECLDILDENIDILNEISSDIEYEELGDDLEPSLELCELYDFAEDVANSVRIKTAEGGLMERQLL